jgi:SRSO17 transposase
MNKEEIEAIGPALTEFLQPFERFFNDGPNVRHFRNYSRGLLSDLERKTAEPMAIFAGTPPRTLQYFLRSCVWDHEGLTNALQRALCCRVEGFPADPVGTVCILDETSALKKGKRTPGVQRQYLGCVGKIDNGIVTVHLAVVKGRFKGLLDSELYLPESWREDRERCREADIPDEMEYKAKWEIGLDLLERANSNGWEFDWLVFDEGYGSKPGFLEKLDCMGQVYVGEVPKSFSCRLEGTGRRKKAEELFLQGDREKEPAKAYRLKQETGSVSVWEVKTINVALGKQARARHRLLLAVNPKTGEQKYFLTNAGKEVSVGRILRAAFKRWHVEHVFRVAKGEVGLTHFEGRSYVSLKRHMTLCLVVMAFLVLHTMKLREKKTVDNP